MKTTIKVFGIAGIVCGILAVFSYVDSQDFYAVIGGLWFIGWGICDLVYIGEQEDKKKK